MDDDNIRKKIASLPLATTTFPVQYVDVRYVFGLVFACQHALWYRHDMVDCQILSKFLFFVFDRRVQKCGVKTFVPQKSPSSNFGGKCV